MKEKNLHYLKSSWKKSLSPGQHEESNFPGSFPKRETEVMKRVSLFSGADRSKSRARSSCQSYPPNPAIVSTPPKLIFLCCQSREATWYLMVPRYSIHCQVGCYLWFPGWAGQMKARWQLSLLEDITEGPREGLPDNYAFAKVSSTSSNFPAKAPPWDKKTAQISRSGVRTECFGHSTV